MFFVPTAKEPPNFNKKVIGETASPKIPVPIPLINPINPEDLTLLKGLTNKPSNPSLISRYPLLIPFSAPTIKFFGSSSSSSSINISFFFPKIP